MMSKTERNCVNHLEKVLGDPLQFKFHYNGIMSDRWDKRLQLLDKAMVVLALTELDIHPIYLNNDEYQQVLDKVSKKSKPFRYV
jgi:hypothetical protein